MWCLLSAYKRSRSMAGRSAKISKRTVDEAKPLERGDLFVRDTDLKGFGLRVTPKGAKSYFLEYRMGGRGAPKGRIAIGKHGSPWSPDTARTKAGELLRKVKEGIDPSVMKRQRSSIAVELAFERYAALFIDRYAKQKQPRSWGQADAALRNHAIPVLKGRPLPDITRREIKGLVERLATTQPPTARYLHATLRKLFRWAVDRGDIDRSPMAEMSGPAAPASRDRVLDERELAACWIEAAATESPFGPAVQLLIATGQRRSEVLEMDFAELDMERATWIIPAERSKNGLAHVVPLNERAMAVLEALGARKRRRGLVFTTTGKTPLSGVSKFKRALDAGMLGRMTKKAREAGFSKSEVHLPPWRMHDLRRTVATGLQQLGIRFEVTEAVLNHVSGARSGVAGVYQRYSWEAEKRAALDAWSRRLDDIIREESPANNVVPLKHTAS